MSEGVAQIVHDRLRKRQETAYQWALDTYGNRALGSRYQALRLVEEAMELGQTQGLTEADFVLVAAYVSAKKAGETRGEVGDLAISLLILAENLGLSVDSCLTDTLNRIHALDPDACRRKDDEKIKFGLI
ncbi:hypothetical protein CcrColossus_gp215 [Caulobacter phage CcrColossus]|uniref:Uncharacterized protein n=1 Tax=Caulobacter phage CcrColossus TaxID=1211640 RepID=K4JUQ7_9CAUD|nr:hypothetical protein CcrColossus_gp215 [Caulobacter phage CcrColossus]AFU88085.1 hypothetical protein CcrColossus_gp215 [Caulobacter phage CcrColossus]